MSKATITIEGFVAKDPEVRNVTGHSITTVTVPVTPQKKNAQGGYEDSGDTVWYQAEFWDEHGSAVAQDVRKGQLVIVSGELEVKGWESGDKAGTNTIVKFPTISVVIRKPSRNGSQQPATAPAEETWAATPPASGDGSNGGFSFEEPTPF